MTCPSCGTFEQHRLQLLACLKDGLFNLFPSSILLHIGSENCEKQFLRQAIKYSVTYLVKENVDENVCADLTRLSFAYNTVDIVLSSHILEPIIVFIAIS